MAHFVGWKQGGSEVEAGVEAGWKQGGSRVEASDFGWKLPKLHPRFAWFFAHSERRTFLYYNIKEGDMCPAIQIPPPALAWVWTIPLEF